MICLKYSNANSLMGTYLGSLERAQFTAIYSDFSVILVQVPVTYLVLFGELQNLFHVTRDPRRGGSYQQSGCFMYKQVNEFIIGIRALIDIIEN